MITVDDKQLQYAKDVLQHIPKAAPKAVARAINRARQAGKTAALKKISSEYTIKQKRISETLDFGKATPNNLSAFIRSTGRPNALSYFKTNPTKVPKGRPKNPVFVQVKRGGGGTIKSAFLAIMRSGHIGVFNRKSTSSLPIIQHFGPSVPQMLESKSVTAFICDKAQEVLNERLEHEIDVILQGAVK